MTKGFGKSMSPLQGSDVVDVFGYKHATPSGFGGISPHHANGMQRSRRANQSRRDDMIIENVSSQRLTPHPVRDGSLGRNIIEGWSHSVGMHPAPSVPPIQSKQSVYRHVRGRIPNGMRGLCVPVFYQAMHSYGMQGSRGTNPVRDSSSVAAENQICSHAVRYGKKQKRCWNDVAYPSTTSTGSVTAGMSYGMQGHWNAMTKRSGKSMSPRNNFALSCRGEPVCNFTLLSLTLCHSEPAKNLKVRLMVSERFFTAPACRQTGSE